MHSQGFEHMRMSHEREGLSSNYKRIIDGHLAKAPASKLADAMQKLSFNSDGKIHELGL